MLLDEGKWESYFKFGTRLFLKKKTIIFKQGEVGEGFYYLHKGLVKIIAPTSKGEERILNFLGPGHLFGEQTMDEQPYFSTVVTTVESVLYYFPCDIFKEIITQHPELLDLFTRALSRKMNVLLDRINAHALPTQQHVAIALLKISEISATYSIPITQEELASYMGLSRITLYKILKKWRSQEIIDIQRRMFSIKQPEVLHEYTCTPPT